MVTANKKAERQSRSINLERAKEMRHEPSATEKLFWAQIRNRKLAGFKFKRQVPIGPFIADYVCPEKKLIVELDGPLHDVEYDAARDRYLEKQGYRVLRFKNEEIGSTFGVALVTLRHALQQPPHPNPLPR